MSLADEISVKYQHLRQNIDLICLRLERDPSGVQILPVSKTFDVSVVQAAMDIGLKRFGENKVQELKQKSSQVAQAQWVLIGHLQTNKAKEVARYASEIQSLDSDELAKVLDRRLQIEGRSLDALIQVKTSTEDSKTGMNPDDVLAFAKNFKFYSGMNLKGLMTIAQNSTDEELTRSCFRTLRNLRDQLQNELGQALPVLSMGMSADYAIALEEGSTEIRVGQGLFGKRDSKY